MHFPRRIHGIENEFGIVAQYPDGTITNLLDNHIGDLVCVTRIADSVLSRTSGKGHRVWHSSGACTYVDRGNHPEYATPECSHIRDLVRYNKAGELIVRKMFDRQFSHGIRFLLFKNNIGYDTMTGASGVCDSFGCHENYSVRYYDHGKFDTADVKLKTFHRMIPFLATRQLFDGAGWWDKDDHFHLSQRASCIQKEFGTSAVHERPFMQMKADAVDPDLRLHIISGDANICEFALYLKMGTTSLVLSLLESGRCPNIICTNPIEALKAISYHGDPYIRSLKMGNGSAMSALDTQIVFLDAVRRELPCATYADEELEHEIKQIVLYWEQTINAIANHDHEWMNGRIDHATKKYLAEIQIARTLSLDHSQQLDLCHNIDILYHAISNRALQQRMNARWPARRIVTDVDIADALEHAPSNTRAHLREKFVRALIANEINSMEFHNWSRFDIHDQYGDHHSFDLPHGLETDRVGFDSFLSMIKRKRMP